MKYTLLGNTGMRISKLGFGGIPIQNLSLDDAQEVIEKSLEVGINFFDTARGYTVSERYLGHALKGKRDQAYLATKSPSLNRDGMLADVEKSLRDLQTDFIDLYQLHNVASVGDLWRALRGDGSLKALLQLKDEGTIGHIGVTTHKEEVLKAALDEDIFETFQFPFNTVESQGEKALEEAVKRGTGTIAMKPLAGGALDNAFDSLRYALEAPFISVVIPGMDSIGQVEENARAVDIGPLTSQEREKLMAMAKELGNHFCRRCGYCLPCPEGIQIPSMFTLEGYYSRYDLKDWAMEKYLSQNKTAVDCVECGTCESRCPYELPIIDMMKEVEKTFKA